LAEGKARFTFTSSVGMKARGEITVVK
jgi:hypothetical protein